MIKFITLIVLALLSTNPTSAQDYYDKHKTCSEILAGVTPEDSTFWNKLNERNACLLGTKAPNFEATTITNRLFSTKQTNNKVTVLHFWFTTCVPCIEEMPYLNSLVSKYKKDSISFISFATEDLATIQNFLKKKSFKFEIAPNGAAFLYETFKLFTAWPTTIILDKDGIIRFLKTGPLNTKEDNHLAVIQDALSQVHSNQ